MWDSFVPMNKESLQQNNYYIFYRSLKSQTPSSHIFGYDLQLNVIAETSDTKPALRTYSFPSSRKLLDRTPPSARLCVQKYGLPIMAGLYVGFVCSHE